MILLRLAFAFLPELRHLLKWCSLVVFGIFTLTAPMLAVHTQPWSPWWFTGNTTASPGVVPDAAILAPQGPLLADATPLMAAIQPYMGVRYLFGGNDTRGIDCSGFVVAVFRALGISLPRTAQTQWNATERIATPEVGDLVFFERTYSSPDRITHVGIVVAPGWMISAAEPVVGRQSFAGGFWASHFVGYGRIRRSVPNQA